MLSEREAWQRYFDTIHTAMMWKVTGVSEYALRRPMTPTGSNLLGILKHVGLVEFGYFGECFGRPVPEQLPDEFGPDSAPNADMFARADEAADEIIARFQRAGTFVSEAIAALDLDAVGVVPWWAEDRRDVTLRQICMHMLAELNRHAGHLDIIRELIDGQAGLNSVNANMPDSTEISWPDYVADLEQIASGFPR